MKAVITDGSDAATQGMIGLANECEMSVVFTGRSESQNGRPGSARSRSA
jgi:hypothetical protein